MASPYKLSGAKKLINEAFIISFRVLFFLFTTPFDLREYSGVNSYIIPPFS